MADIDVVPKHRSYTWLWVLLTVIVIAALVLLFAGRPREVTELPQDGQSIVAMSVIPLGWLTLMQRHAAGQTTAVSTTVVCLAAQ